MDKKQFLLPQAFCICISGEDAIRIANNLCTNDIKNLADRSSVEAFVTNARGWAQALATYFRVGSQIYMVGQCPDSSVIVSHIERYIIREDARIEDLSRSCQVLVFEGLDDQELKRLDDHSDVLFATHCSIFPRATIAALSAPAEIPAINEELQCRAADETEFEIKRILAGWPMLGREITDKSLPQELDRNDTAISFNKGCYLGQETIARLDALGQIQRKLCVLQIMNSDETVSSSPEEFVEATVFDGEKEVGKLTACSQNEVGKFGLATIKRGSFKPGNELRIGESSAIVVPRLV